MVELPAQLPAAYRIGCSNKKRRLQVLRQTKVLPNHKADVVESGSPREIQLSFIDIMVKRLRSIDQQIQKNPAFKADETYYKDLFKEALALYQKHSTITLHGAAEIMLWLAWKFPELRDQLPD